MTDETVNQEVSKQQAASDATTVNNGGSGAQQQGTEQNDPKWLDARLARAKEQERKQLLAELGFESADDLKALVSDVKAKKDAELSEAQRLQKQLDTLKAKAEAAEQKAAQIEAARILDKVNGALRTAAITAGAEHPDDVIEYLRRAASGDVEGIIDSEGKIDEAAIKKLMERTRKERANYFKSQGVGSPSNRGGKNADPTQQNKDNKGKALFRL